jgi:peptide/nickel transport system substrate-binding protein
MQRGLVLFATILLSVECGVILEVFGQTKDDTVVYAIQSDIGSWDPPNATTREALSLGYHVFDNLAVRDLKTGRIVPHLALSWRPLNDTTWELKLRQGVRFQDGGKFTAHDVKATFDRVLDPQRKLAHRGDHVKIKSVEVVDDYTVRFNTDGPYPLFVESLTAQVIQSEKVIKEKGDEWMQENPVGTGPYKLVRWLRKREHLLIRNDDYWDRKPVYKYVRVRIIPEMATQIAELLSGGVDIMKAVPPDQFDVINKSGVARTATTPILRTSMIQLDQAGRSGPNPFTDPRVRKAANMAVEMDGIIKHVLNGYADRFATAINPLAFGYDPSLKPYRQDIATAKKLLAEAGYPNGIDVRFQTGLETAEPGLLQTNEAIIADLTKAGIRTQQNYIGDQTVYIARLRDGKAGPMFNFTWGYTSIFDADAILYQVFSCQSHWSYYCNKELDQLTLAGRSVLDENKRREIYARAQKILFDDAVYLYKWGLRGIWGLSNRINYDVPRDEIDRMFNVSPRS